MIFFDWWVMAQVKRLDFGGNLHHDLLDSGILKDSSVICNNVESPKVYFAIICQFFTLIG